MFSLMVIYRKQAGRFRASTLSFERGPLTDPKLGNVLALTPNQLQAAVQDRDGDAFQLARPLALQHRSLAAASSRRERAPPTLLRLYPPPGHVHHHLAER
jgi:hypothetical protein